MSTYFNATSPSTLRSVRDLVVYLELLANALFPENGIEYFSQLFAGTQRMGDEALPAPGSVRGPAVFTYQGSCEGRIIRIGALTRTDELLQFAWIKTFGKAEECWAIARAISEALESILCDEATPEIVDYFLRMPREATWRRETSLAERVEITHDESSFRVATVSGRVLDFRDFSKDGVNARFYVTPRVTDWCTVLTNMKADFAVVDRVTKSVI